MLKKILQSISVIEVTGGWEVIEHQGKFSVKKMYHI